MTEKICFVVMGFGKKMDYCNSTEVDLDQIYQKVVQPLFHDRFPEYKLIRADEINGSQLIDISMYQLLFNADLVIADITTLNPNAIYELGVRHAIRPFSTIITSQTISNLPFDLKHNRVFQYPEFGNTMDEHEVLKIKDGLEKYVKVADEDSIVDSPFYTYMPKISPPKLIDEELDEVVKKVEPQSDSIYFKFNSAKKLMNNSNFSEAIPLWEELSGLMTDNDYVKQQFALATYKSKLPNETLALQHGLMILSKLNPEKSLDTETIGLSGAIYRRLYEINDNIDYLNQAIEFYKRGFTIKGDYYNGENYATCLLRKTKAGKEDDDFTIYAKYECKSVFERIIQSINVSISKGDESFWMYATLAASNLYLGNIEEFERNKKIFGKKAKADWQVETFKDTVKFIKEFLG